MHKWIKLYRIGYIFTIMGFWSLMGCYVLLHAENVSANDAHIRIPAETEVDGDKITLGGIAAIEASDPRITTRLEGVVIGNSPSPGKSRTLDAKFVRKRIRQAGIDFSAMVLEIPPKIRISRSFIEINEEKLKEIIIAFVQQQIGQDSKEARIKEIKVDRSIILPKGPVSYKIKPQRNSEFIGRVPLAIEFTANDNFQKKIWASVTIEVMVDVVTAARSIGRYQPITENDISVQKMDLAELPSDVVTQPESVLGKRAKRSIRNGSVLKNSLIEFPPLVKRGDMVTIVAETSGMKLTALGEVKKKGRFGERIPVINFDSNKVIFAIVQDSQTVRVDF